MPDPQGGSQGIWNSPTASFSIRRQSARPGSATSVRKAGRRVMGNMAPRLQGLRHLALRVRDIGKAKDFYIKVLGMKVVWEPDPQNCYLSSGNDNLALQETAAEHGPEQALDDTRDHSG